MKFKDIQKNLKKKLKPNRYKHTLGVVETAEHLAVIYGYDVEKARLTALLHDCAKHVSDEEKIDMCVKYGVAISDAEYANVSLLHAKCGAILAKTVYQVDDPDILHAITYHTTGCEHMNLLDQIIFVSDYIEPGRDKAPHLKELRKLADTDLDETCFRILEDTISYLGKGNSGAIDRTTVKAYEYYKKLVDDRSETEKGEKV